MSSKLLGFVGVGQIGGPMAKRLMDHGYSLVVYDVRTEALAPFIAAGATAAKSPAEVASATDIVLASLPTPQIVKQVALGANGLHEGTQIRTYIELSTIGSIVAREVAAGLAKKGIATLDSPVSGGIAGVEKGTLAMMVGGDAAKLEECRPILAALGKIFHIGENAGDGQMMKLVNNMLSATTMAATAEAVVVGVKGGLDPVKLIEALNAGSGRSSASIDKFPRSVLNGTFNYGFKTALMVKDVKLYLDEAEKLGAALWMGGAVGQIWGFMMSQGGADKDLTEIVKLYEQWAGGVECRRREPVASAPSS